MRLTNTTKNANKRANTTYIIVHWELHQSFIVEEPSREKDDNVLFYPQYLWKNSNLNLSPLAIIFIL